MCLDFFFFKGNQDHFTERTEPTEMGALGVKIVAAPLKSLWNFSSYFKYSLGSLGWEENWVKFCLKTM